MKPQNLKRKIISSSLIIFLIILMITSSTIGVNNTKNNDKALSSLNMADSIPYDGYLRIYIVEPDSRWNMEDGAPYTNGFLDYAFDDTISIDYLETYEDTISWKGDVTEDNVIVMAAIFNQQANLRYSNLPNADKIKPFEAYPVEASAAATPGTIGYNTVTEDFTHTVFIEEGTVTWCPDCPAMGHALYDIYESSDYPFYYVALVEDMDATANNRVMNEYNLWGYPTGYIDGGYKVLTGGIRDEAPYRALIESSGQKDVHEFNMTLSVE